MKKSSEVEEEARNLKERERQRMEKQTRHATRKASATGNYRSTRENPGEREPMRAIAPSALLYNAVGF